MNKHIPDSITQENNTAGLQVSKIQFYEDDLKKYLIENNRYID